MYSIINPVGIVYFNRYWMTFSDPFRNQDFGPGKRNYCDFLQYHFSLPYSNPMVDYIYKEGLVSKYQNRLAKIGAQF